VQHYFVVRIILEKLYPSAATVSVDTEKPYCVQTTVYEVKLPPECMALL